MILFGVGGFLWNLDKLCTAYQKKIWVSINILNFLGPIWENRGVFSKILGLFEHTTMYGKGTPTFKNGSWGVDLPVSLNKINDIQRTTRAPASLYPELLL